MVATQINAHVDFNALRDPFQSAYCRRHSTETALLRIKNDVSAALYRKCMVLLVLLDLSSAFDTLDHHLLLNRLKYSCGITGSAIAWLQSYLSNRHQKVVDGVASNDSVLTCGVPHGSVLGPILYCLYTRCIGDIITRYGLQYHCYADGIQIYVTIEPDSTLAAAKCELGQCTNNISLWLQKNKLKLNKEKTEAILFRNKYQHAAVSADVFLTIAGHRVTARSSVRDLGVVLDNTLSMQAHVGQVTKSCYYQLRNIGQIRRSINEGACKTLVHALVTSRIDYCNSVLYGAYETLLRELQREDHGRGVRNFLRMEIPQFEMLCEAIGPSIERANTNMRQSICPRERIAITLRFLASGKRQ